MDQPSTSTHRPRRLTAQQAIDLMNALDSDFEEDSIDYDGSDSDSDKSRSRSSSDNNDEPWPRSSTRITNDSSSADEGEPPLSQGPSRPKRANGKARSNTNNSLQCT